MRPIIFESERGLWKWDAAREQSQRQRQRILTTQQQQRWGDANYHFDKWFSLSDSVKLESFINFFSKTLKKKKFALRLGHACVCALNVLFFVGCRPFVSIKDPFQSISHEYFILFRLRFHVSFGAAILCHDLIRSSYQNE